MNWTHGNVFALAPSSCAVCEGAGFRQRTNLIKHGAPERVCNCVLRSIFRICFERFQQCVAAQHRIGAVSLEHSGGKDTRKTYGRKNEEYIADFCNLSKRYLTTTEYKLFSSHFLLGADWKLCCRQLGMSRGNFFHAVYRIEQKLGTVFATLEPYGLYPVCEYFGKGDSRAEPCKLAHTKDSRILRPPLRKVA